MKKIFNFLIFPILAVMIFCGCSCGKDKSIEDVQNAYGSMINSFIGEENHNVFFNDAENPYRIAISYTTAVEEAISIQNPSTDIQKRYKALFYQQKLLDEIFNFYNTYEEHFYTVTKNADLEEKEINNLYNSIINLHETLEEFKSQYNTFIAATQNGLSNVMQFNLTSYSFHLNKVIDASFDFILKFKDIYIRECVVDYSIYNKENLVSYVDVAYLDMAHIIYLENFKSFNDGVGDNGICDLSGVVGNESMFNLLNDLLVRKTISMAITSNVGCDTEIGRDADKTVDAFIYARNVFNQRKNTYLNMYNSLDVYTINQYKYGLSGINYNSYLLTLSVSERATIQGLDNFITDVYMNYLDKLNTIVE